MKPWLRVGVKLNPGDTQMDKMHVSPQRPQHLTVWSQRSSPLGQMAVEEEEKANKWSHCFPFFKLWLKPHLFQEAFPVHLPLLPSCHLTQCWAMQQQNHLFVSAARSGSCKPHLESQIVHCPFFINKVLSGHSHSHLFIYFICGWS